MFTATTKPDGLTDKCTGGIEHHGHVVATLHFTVGKPSQSTEVREGHAFTGFGVVVDLGAFPEACTQKWRNGQRIAFSLITGAEQAFFALIGRIELVLVLQDIGCLTVKTKVFRVIRYRCCAIDLRVSLD